MHIEPSPVTLLPLTTALTAVGQQAAPAATMAHNLVDVLITALPDLDGAALYWRADDRASCLARVGEQDYPASLAVDRATALGQAILDNQIQTDPSATPGAGLHVVVPLPGADHAALGALIVHAADDRALFGERRGVVQVAAQIMALALTDRAGREVETQAADSPTIPSLLTQTSQLLDEMHAQYDASRRIVLAGDAGEMLQALVDFVGEGCLYAELGQYEDARPDAAPARLRTLAVITPDGLQRGEAETAFADHPARAAYETLADGLPLVIPDAQHEAELDEGSRAAFGVRGANSVIVLPLISERLPLGQIVLGGDSPEALGTDRVRAYQSLADQIASAMGRTLLLDTLARERNLLRTLIDNIPDYIFVKDRQSRMVINNLAHAAGLFGSTPEAVVGKTDFDFFPPDLAQQYFEDEQGLMERGEALIDLEEPSVDQEGNPKWHLATKLPLRDEQGNVTGLVGIVRDITARKLAEQERERLLAILETRARQLQTAAEISRAASSILDPEALMWQAVRLIRERFDLYYAGIFLVDEEGKDAWLRAGTGEAGQQMLMAGHKLAVGGSSMIGWCIAHQQARIALDVGQEAVRFENPLLPETRTEMALPLISRGQAIGAMTIQSTREAAFAEEDIAVLQTMADQLANAIENARLFAQARARAAREQNLNRIAARLQEHADVNTLLNAAVEGLGRALGARTGRVRLSTPDQVADLGGQGNGDQADGDGA